MTDLRLSDGTVLECRPSFGTGDPGDLFVNGKEARHFDMWAALTAEVAAREKAEAERDVIMAKLYLRSRTK